MDIVWRRGAKVRFDGYCGTSPKSRKNVRIITELAWQHHFAKNMFIRPESEAEVADFVPDFTIINACKVVNDDYKVTKKTCEAVTKMEEETKRSNVNVILERARA